MSGRRVITGRVNRERKLIGLRFDALEITVLVMEKILHLKRPEGVTAQELYGAAPPHRQAELYAASQAVADYLASILQNPISAEDLPEDVLAEAESEGETRQ